MLDLTVPNGTSGVLQVQLESSDLPLLNNVGFQAVVVVEREFPTLSGELLDFLQSLPGKWDVDVLLYAVWDREWVMHILLPLCSLLHVHVRSEVLCVLLYL